MEENEKVLKKGFFKKVWYSIFKLERYGEMSAEGFGRAIKYIVQISIIFTLILCIATIFQIDGKVKKGMVFLDEQVGDFTYADGTLKLEKEEPVIAPSSTLGTIIIDTNIENDEDLNKYFNSLDSSMEVIISKNKISIKGLSDSGIINYQYSKLLGEMGINKLNKQDFIDLVNNNKTSFYAQIFMIVFLYLLLSTIISVLITALILSVFGFIATLGTKMKIRYVAIFNLAVYSLTLSMLLQAIYIGVNVTTGFTIKYFQVMYIAVAAIYLIASIFLIKSEFIKKQMQEIQNAQRVKEEQKNEDEEQKEEKKDEKQEDNKDNKDTNTNDNPTEENKGNKENEPEGSGASLVKKEGA